MAAVPESSTIVNALRSGLVPAQGLERFATGLESLLEAVNQERGMEAVGLWRDSQKALTDIFEHWTAYANLTRRQRVMNSDV